MSQVIWLATAAGARLIYQQSKWAVLVSAALIVGAVYAALQQDFLSITLSAIVVAYIGILIFGFLMQAGLLFQPVRKPVFISIEQAIEKFGADEEVMGVVDAVGKPFAFITSLARRPHVVYQPDGDEPFIMSHCILSHSSMSYATRGDFKQPDILVVAVKANNMVCYEKNKRCAVVQIQNRSRRGEINLETLSTVSVKLKTWQALYPKSRIWNPTGACIDGELAGRQLTMIPYYNKIFWYVWADFHQATKVYSVSPGDTNIPAEEAA